MATINTFNGVNYTIPDIGDENWGGTQGVDGLLRALVSNVLSRAGGLYTLSADVDWGGLAGHVATYYKSRTSNISTTGVLRLARTDAIAWRNQANNADISLAVDSSNNLTWNGNIITTAAAVIPTTQGGTGLSSWTAGDIPYYATGTALSKLGIAADGALLRSTGSAPAWLTIGADGTVLTVASGALSYAQIANANVASAADISIGKLAGTNANRLVATNAGSNRLGQIAAITSGHVLIADANGLPVGEQFLSKARGGAGADQSSVTYPSTGTIATIAGTQVLTNKDYDGGTASNSSRITVPQASLATLQGLTRKEGTLVYATDVDRLYIDTGAALTAVGAGSGTTNYCTNPDAEASTSGWATYADAAGTAPVDGTGGSPVSTWTRTTVTPLQGIASFLLTKDAANRQGEGASFDFTIDTADQAKQIVVAFDAQSTANYVAGDVKMYVVDVTNGTVIQLAPADVQKSDGSGGSRFVGTFQASSNSTSYRLCFHIATTNALAYTLEVDRVSIAPTTVAFAASVNDWESVTVTGSWVTNSTYVARRRRVGDSEEYDVTITTAGAPTATALTLTLPTGRTIDTTKLSGTGANAQALGYGSAMDTGVQQYPVEVLYASSTTVKVAALNAASTYAGGADVTATIPFTFGATDTIQVRFIVPILGFGSNIQVGGYDGRTVAARYTSSSSAMSTSPTTVVFPTRDYDTHGAYNTSGAFTAPVSGYYRATAAMRTASASWTANNGFFFNWRKNGSIFKTIYNYAAVTASFQLGGQGACEIFLNAGDTLDLQCQNSQSAAASGNAVDNVFEISLVPGRSTLAAGDTVASRASGSTTSLSAGAYTTAVFPTVVFDRTGSYNAAAGTWTAPIAGFYQVSASMRTGSVAWTAGHEYGVGFSVNGGTEVLATLSRVAANVTTVMGLSSSGVLQLNAGDVVRVRVFSSVAVSLTGAENNFFSIVKVGN